jgi:hypothetical protein
MSPVEVASGNDAQRFYNHVNTERKADGLMRIMKLQSVYLAL